MKQCEWCGKNQAILDVNTVYWELPDGTKAIQITNTPCMKCKHCGMEYQEEEVIKKIEDQLFLIDTKLLDKTVSYEKLMEMERILKRNYFDF